MDTVAGSDVVVSGIGSRAGAYLSKFFEFLLEVWHKRHTITELTKNDIRVRYLGSILGISWAFIHPALTILILWFVFEMGFKSGSVHDCPFVLWLTCGLVPWFFFSDGLASGTNSITEQSYLVNKVVFRVSILPIIKVLSALVIHLVFALILFSLFLLTGEGITLYAIQIFYYMTLMTLLVLGLSWITSSIVVFFKDLAQMIAIVLQLGFWVTPIFWELGTIPARYHILFKLNPMFYIVQGYRESLIEHRWFWESPSLTLYAIGVTFFVFVVGGVTFMRLRPHFADVL